MCSAGILLVEIVTSFSVPLNSAQAQANAPGPAGILDQANKSVQTNKMSSGLPSDTKAHASTKLKAGQPLVCGAGVEDLKATYDVDLARKQVAAYPDSPDAHFILAVALTRTNFVEQALKEIQQARKLAEVHGGPAYFDKTIKSYEQVLKNYPEENEVRYGLAWAYYMKAYLVAKHYQREQRALATSKAVAQGIVVTSRVKGNQTNKNPNLSVMPVHQSPDVPWEQAAAAGSAASGPAASGTSASEPASLGSTLPTKNTASPDIGPAKPYYEAAINNMNELLQRDPLDVWTMIYRAFLQAQYSGDLNASMNTWRVCLGKFPNNPVPYFFLGEGYLKQGNLKASLQNVSKAISLRAAPAQ